MYICMEGVRLGPHRGDVTYTILEVSHIDCQLLHLSAVVRRKRIKCKSHTRPIISTVSWFGQLRTS